MMGRWVSPGICVVLCVIIGACGGIRDTLHLIKWGLDVPSAFAFGAVTVGETKRADITLTTTKSATVSVLSIVSSEDDVGVEKPGPIEIEGLTSVVVPLSWTPSTVGSFSGAVVVTVQAPKVKTYVIALSGEAIAAPLCADTNQCTIDTEVDGVCSHVQADDGLPCDDGSSCSVLDVCQAGICTGTPSTAPECNEIQPDNKCPEVNCTGDLLTADPFSGSGSTDDPFVICTAAQWAALADHSAEVLYDKVILIGADIDFSSFDGLGGRPALSPIEGGYFQSTIRGCNRTLSNIRLRSSSTNVALIGVLGVNGKIQNLRLVNVDIASTSSAENLRVAALAGSGLGEISNVFVSGVIEGRAGIGEADPTGPVGGVVGYFGGTIKNVEVDVQVRGDCQTGGIVGLLTGGAVTDVKASGKIMPTATGSGVYATLGGVVGWTDGGEIIRASSTVDIDGISGAGGACGGVVGNGQHAPVEQSFWSGSISNCFHGGGIAGQMPIAIRDSFSAGTISSLFISGGLAGDVYQSVVERSYSTAVVTAIDPNGVYTETAGGLVGFDNSKAVIRASFFTGHVSSDSSLVGGIAACCGQVTLASCYWVDLSSGEFEVKCSYGRDNVPGVCEDVASVSEFYGNSHAVYATWDFDTVWQASPTGLPTLRGLNP